MKDLMKYGLTSQQIEIITRIASKFETAESLILFGSRTKGNFKTSSDIDLCIKGNITFSQLARIKTLLEETTSIPYFFDLISYNDIDNDLLKKEIDEYGQILWQRLEF